MIPTRLTKEDAHSACFKCLMTRESSKGPLFAFGNQTYNCVMSTAENELFGFHGGWDTEGYSEAPCPKDYVDILSGELRKDNRKLESEYMKYKKEQKQNEPCFKCLSSRDPENGNLFAFGNQTYNCVMSAAENKLFNFEGGWDTQGYKEAPCPKDYVDVLTQELRKDMRNLSSKYSKYKKERKQNLACFKCLESRDPDDGKLFAFGNRTYNCVMSAAENKLFGFDGGWDTEGYDEAPCPKDYVDVFTQGLRKDNRDLSSKYTKYKNFQRQNRSCFNCLETREPSKGKLFVMGNDTYNCVMSAAENKLFNFEGGWDTQGYKKAPCPKDYVNALTGDFHVDDRNLALRYSEYKKEREQNKSCFNCLKTREPSKGKLFAIGNQTFNCVMSAAENKLFNFEGGWDTEGYDEAPCPKDYVNVLSGNFQIDERNLAFKYSKFKTDQAKTEKKATKKNISVELLDSWGDGWNGVEVFQKDTDGKLQNTLTLETGSEATKQISVQCGKEITFECSKKGQYHNEVSFKIGNKTYTDCPKHQGNNPWRVTIPCD